MNNVSSIIWLIPIIFILAFTLWMLKKKDWPGVFVGFCLMGLAQIGASIIPNHSILPLWVKTAIQILIISVIVVYSSIKIYQRKSS